MKTGQKSAFQIDREFGKRYNKILCNAADQLNRGVGMKKGGKTKYLFALLAVLFTVLAAAAALFCREKAPVLVYAPEEAVQRVEELMTAVCDGDFAKAETLLYGCPDLGADREPADAVGIMIWQAYLESLDYQLVGDCYATDAGLAQDVKIISLELSSATEQLGRRARELLNGEVEAAEDVSEIYDENNAYREDLVMEVLREAARQALEEDVRYTYRTVTLQLVYSQDQWWVAADQTFLSAISGGTAG